MAAFASVWLGLACLLTALTMLLWRPAMTDVTIFLVLWLGAPGTMCIAGMVLWADRKEDADQPGIGAQRLQCKVAVLLSVAAVAVVYGLIIRAQWIPAGLP